MPVVTLDDYIADIAIPESRWVKIDTEGAEIRIRKGAAQLLQGEANVILGLHPYAWEEFGSLLAERKILAKAAGREGRYLDHPTEIGDNAFFGALAINRH